MSGVCPAHVTCLGFGGMMHWDWKACPLVQCALNGPGPGVFVTSRPNNHPATAAERDRYALHVEAVLVADTGPRCLLEAERKAVKDSRDNIDKPRLQEVNKSLSQCRE
jgi:hypothetical protein